MIVVFDYYDILVFFDILLVFLHKIIVDEIALSVFSHNINVEGLLFFAAECPRRHCWI